MTSIRLVTGLALLGAVAACSDEVSDPTGPQATAAFATVASCPLAQVPAGAHIVTCFNTTLLPGVWHGWILALSDAQPPGTGNGLDFFDRDRLNHPYVLASPQGFTRWGNSDPLAPSLPLNESAYAFQAEFNGSLWFDVLRLIANPDGPAQNVAIVVYWADAPTMAADIKSVIDGMQSAGILNGGQSNALGRKIDHALELLAKGKVAEAIVVLQNFIQQVNDMTAAGVLTSEKANELISRANYFLEVAG